MSGRERMMAAMRGQPTDRVPIHVWGVHAWDDEWVNTRHPSYRPVIEAVREHGDYRAPWSAGSGPFLSATTDLKVTAEQVDHRDWIETITTLHAPRGPLRTRFLASKRGLPGMTVEFWVKTLEDVERVLSAPYVRPAPPDPAGFHAREALLGDRGVVGVDLWSDPIGNVHDLMGSELLALWSIEERGTILRLVDLFLERCLDRLDSLLAAGVGPLFTTGGQEYVTPPLHSPRDFRELCVDPERRIIRRLHDAGCLLHVHCHGPVNAVLEDLAEIADVLHPLEPPPLGNVELRDAKRRLSGRVCIEGNVQIGDIYALPTTRLVDKVKRALDEGAPGGRFILCPTASPHTEVLSDLTVRNYVAMVQTAAEHGR